MSRSNVYYFGQEQAKDIPARIFEFRKKDVWFCNFVVNFGNFLYRIFRSASVGTAQPGGTGLYNSDSCSTLAQEVMLTHVCAQNFGHLYWFGEIEVVGFPNVSGLHVLSCLVHEFLCFVPYIFDNLNCIH
jgi:hypothetical protein